MVPWKQLHQPTALRPRSFSAPKRPSQATSGRQKSEQGALSTNWVRAPENPSGTSQRKMSTSDAYRRRLERLVTRGSASSYSPSSPKKPTAESPVTTAPQTLSDPTATSACDESPRAVRLSERIRYIHCDGEEGRTSHGVMTFCSAGGAPLFVKEVESQEDFKLNYSVFRMMEDLL